MARVQEHNQLYNKEIAPQADDEQKGKEITKTRMAWLVPLPPVFPAKLFYLLSASLTTLQNTSKYMLQHLSIPRINKLAQVP